MSAVTTDTGTENKMILALRFVERVDSDLTRGVRHYRNKAGVLLTTLDEVVRAVLDDELAINETGNDND